MQKNNKFIKEKALKTGNMIFAVDELNYLVYRYLEESGFQHSAFVFENEANISQSNIKAVQVPYAALLTILQKGLRYTLIERNLEVDGEDVSIPLKELSLLDAVTPEVKLLKANTDADKTSLKNPSSTGGAKSVVKTECDGSEANKFPTKLDSNVVNTTSSSKNNLNGDSIYSKTSSAKQKSGSEHSAPARNTFDDVLEKYEHHSSEAVATATDTVGLEDTKQKKLSSTSSTSSL